MSRVASVAGSTAAIGAAAVGVVATAFVTTFATAAFASPVSNPLAALSADQNTHKAVTDFRSVSSFHIAGAVSASGQQETFSLSLSQKACSGTVVMSKQGSFAIVEIGHTVWIQPDNTFWESSGVPAAKVSAVHGKWLESSSTSSDNSLYKGVSPICSPSQYLAGSVPAGGWAKGKTTTIAGERALELTEKGTVMYVSVAAKPEILRVTHGSASSLTFSAFGVPVKASAPAASQVLPRS